MRISDWSPDVCSSDRAEAVCRHYLSRGRREGRYWIVGDVRNAAGRSMYVRLKDSPKGPAGKWTDAATGEHGDLLDVIRESHGLVEIGRAHVRTPVTNAQLVCRLLLEKKHIALIKNRISKTHRYKIEIESR